MKKFLVLLPILSALHSLGQPKMQGTIKPAGTVGTADIYVLPSTNFSQADEALTFTLAIPAGPLPAPSIGSSGVAPNKTGSITTITGLRPNILLDNSGALQREVVTSVESIGGVPHYIYTFIFAGTASAPHAWVGGAEQLLFRIAFEGCTSGCDFSSMKLVNLASGGSGQIGYWYQQANATGDITNYQTPFYANPGATLVVNSGSTNGSTLSYIQLGVASTTSLPTSAIRNNGSELQQDRLIVYPNPAKGTLNIILPDGMQTANIRLLTAEGKTVLVNEGGNRNRTLDVRGMAAGVYIVQVVDKDNRTTTVKVVFE
jgi:hypothetical protein